LNEDAQLIEASLGGDNAAFGQLVTKYQDRLYHSVLHVVGSAEDAYDVVQETFVQAYLKLESFRGRSKLYTWLYRIAFNQAISHLRRSKPMISVEQAKDSAGSEPVDPCGEPGQDLMRQERATLVQIALGQLQEDHRTIIVLREIDGLCYDIIAEILDIAVGTVRSRLHRARIQLQKQLQEVLQEELES